MATVDKLLGIKRDTISIYGADPQTNPRPQDFVDVGVLSSLSEIGNEEDGGADTELLSRLGRFLGGRWPHGDALPRPQPLTPCNRKARLSRSSMRAIGWGIDNNAFLDSADALLLDNTAFRKLGVDALPSIGAFAALEFDGVRLRLWSHVSLDLPGNFDVTSCARYSREALAPEFVLKKLPYSPDAHMLAEQRARLAPIVLSETLTADELSLVARYVRGN